MSQFTFSFFDWRTTMVNISFNCCFPIHSFTIPFPNLE